MYAPVTRENSGPMATLDEEEQALRAGQMRPVPLITETVWTGTEWLVHVLVQYRDAPHGGQATGPIWTYREPPTEDHYEEGAVMVNSMTADRVIRRATVAFSHRLRACWPAT